MIPIYKPWITNLEKKYVNEALDSEWISSQGKFIKKFEDTFANYLGVDYAVAVNNGTSACHLALLSAGIRPGDEVIIPDITYIATANAVRYCGATPVIVDVDPYTWNIDLNKIENVISEKTKAIFAVHLLGNPINMEALNKIKEKYNILIIEDAAEALGAKYKQDYIGSKSSCSAFSFFGNKTITTGEGGMVATNSLEIYNKILLYKGQGQTERYFHPVIGFNYRMTNVAAAIGCAQLERIDEIQSEKERVYTTYQKLLPENFIQRLADGSKHSCWMFGIKVDAKIYNKILNQTYFDIRPIFNPISTMPQYKKYLSKSNLRALELKNSVIMLPSYPQLKNKEIKTICSIITQ